jgi:hypothetical protein
MADSFHIRQDLEREMTRGEKLLWWGRPLQGIRLQRGDALAIPFSVLATGIGVLWLIAASRAPLWFFLLGAIPLVPAIVQLLVGHFIYDAYQRSHTRYGVSNNRVLFVRGRGNRQVRSLALNSLNEIIFRENANGGGLLQFGRDKIYLSFGNRAILTGWPGADREMAPQFVLAADARQVYDLICRVKADLK